MNTRSMHAPRRVDDGWEQTELLHRRGRSKQNPRKAGIDWLAFVLIGAAVMVLLSLAYKVTGP